MGLFSGIKKYVVGLIIKTSSDPANLEVRRLYAHCCSCDVLCCSTLMLLCVCFFTEGGSVHFKAQHDPCTGKRSGLIHVQQLTQRDQARNTQLLLSGPV